MFRNSLLLVGLLALIQQQAYGTNQIMEVIYSDDIEYRSSLVDKCAGSVMGGFRCVILLKGEIQDPANDATLVFTRTTNSAEVTKIALKGKILKIEHRH